jgi:hypothetical protein
LPTFDMKDAVAAVEDVTVNVKAKKENLKKILGN